MSDLDDLKRELDAISLGSPKKKRLSTTPSWESEPDDLVRNIVLAFSTPLATKDRYDLAKDRLLKLEGYMPMFSGEEKVKAEAMVNMLKERMNEYERTNPQGLVSKVADFASKLIQTDEQLAQAKSYLASLKRMRLSLVGAWARTMDKYISNLETLISQYQETHLGSPETTPEWLSGFTAEPLFYQENFGEIPSHSATSRYCRVTEIASDQEYELGFEDRDEAMYERGYPDAPDWTFEEPLLTVKKEGNKLTVKVEKYEGQGISRIKYFDQVLWESVGGLGKEGVGESKEITIPAEVLPPVPPPVTTEEPTEEVPVVQAVPSLKDKILSYLPWGFTLTALLVGGVALLGGKKG